MEKNKKANNKPPKPVKTMTEEQRRKHRLAWMCAVLALLNLIALALLILLPYNCRGTYDHRDTDTIVIVDTVVVRDSTHNASENIDRRVEENEGDTTAFMRFSIMWNENGRDLVDLDAHAIEPDGTHIYFDSYRAPRRTDCDGQLDVDMQRPRRTGVENIVWPKAEKLIDGDYEFVIDNYDNKHFGVCIAKLKVGDKSFLYKVQHFSKSDPVEIAIVTIKNHQVENIRHKQQPVE